MANKVFIATSIDGYIADSDGGIDWLHSIPNPEGDDMGYYDFTATVDAIIMGRKTFETVLGFDMEWPYKLPVFVLSSTLQSIPVALEGKVQIVHGDLNEVLSNIHRQGFNDLYIDGGSTIQSFLKANLIDEMIITIIPILLGGGISLFGQLDQPIHFQCVASKRYLDRIVQHRFLKADQ